MVESGGFLLKVQVQSVIGELVAKEILDFGGLLFLLRDTIQLPERRIAIALSAQDLPLAEA